jgi:putative intracellular protease/amidase
MKNICVLYYDRFYEAEVVLAIGNLKKENIFSAALEDRVYISAEKQKFLPDKTIKEVNPEEVDLLIIPGGDPSALFDNPLVEHFITELNKRNKYISGICGGTFLMAKFGVLEGKRCTGSVTGLKAEDDDIKLFDKAIIVNEGVVIDRNAITATAQSYVEFCIELGKVMGVYKNNEEITADYKWLKNIKD